MDCPRLLPPMNGHFVRGECKNVFNSACGVKCASGYQVTRASPIPALRVRRAPVPPLRSLERGAGGVPGEEAILLLWSPR